MWVPTNAQQPNSPAFLNTRKRVLRKETGTKGSGKDRNYRRHYCSPAHLPFEEHLVTPASSGISGSTTGWKTCRGGTLGSDGAGTAASRAATAGPGECYGTGPPRAGTAGHARVVVGVPQPPQGRAEREPQRQLLLLPWLGA
eukprot:RCo017006